MSGGAGGLRILRLKVANVGPISGEVDLGAFDPEITLITGANESGKSTVVAALRAALFESHGTKNRGVRDLQPHGTRDAPEVWVDLEIGDETYQLHKRFLERPLCELRTSGHGSFGGGEAEDALREALGARAPGQRGAARGDMGLWGLLWVTQSEAAFQDPGENLDDDVRDAMHAVIAQQVGTLVGGPGSGSLRRRVLEERDRFWTARRLDETGPLRDARSEETDAEARRQALDDALRAVEGLAREIAARELDLRALRTDRVKLESGARAARGAVSRLEELGRQRQAAGRLHETALLQRATAQERAERRTALAERQAKLQDETNRVTESLREAERTLETRRAAEIDAETAWQARRAEAAAARRAHQEAANRLAAARRAGEAELARARLQETRELNAALAELQDRRRGTLGEGAYQALASLERRHREAQATLRRVGTVVALTGAPPDEAIAVGRESTILLRGAGEIRIVPARAGLREAATRSRERAAALREALDGLGLPSLEAATRLRQVRIEAETERARLAQRLTELAPDGLERLTEAVAQGEVSAAARTRSLKHADRLAKEISDLRAAAALHRIDEDTLRSLERLEQDVQVRRARCESIGTRLKLCAHAPLEVEVEGEAAETLLPEQERSWTLTREARIRLGDLADLVVAPRGEEQTQAAAALAAAERGFAEALSAAALESVDAARVDAQALREARADLALAERRLAEVAPAGEAALRRAVEAAEASHARSARALRLAREVGSDLAAVEAVLRTNAATEESLRRLEARAQAAHGAHAQAHRLAACIATGGVEQTILEPALLELPGGLSLEVTPGEEGAEADALVGRLRADLAAALAAAGVDGIGAAAARHQEGLQDEAKAEALRAQLARLAPHGVDALAATVDAITTGLAEPESAVGDDLAAGETEEAVAREEVETTATRLDAAERARTHAREAREVLDRALSERRGETLGLEAQLQETTARLEAARTETADAALEADLRRRADAEAAAAECLRARAHDLEAVQPELVAQEDRRLGSALEEVDAREHRLELELERLRARLELEASEGRFEAREEAAADLEAKRARRRALEREARAALRLAEVVVRHHAEAERRFLAPVRDLAQPYLTAIRPGTRIRMRADLRLDRVVRGGQEEEFARLSGGTREQLSVIVRLALARVLARSSRALPLILDDIMGWTDDVRFWQVARILRSAAKELQVIVLTCHPNRFARLDAGRTIPLDELRRTANPPA